MVWYVSNSSAHSLFSNSSGIVTDSGMVYLNKYNSVGHVLNTVVWPLIDSSYNSLNSGAFCFWNTFSFHQTFPKYVWIQNYILDSFFLKANKRFTLPVVSWTPAVFSHDITSNNITSLSLFVFFEQYLN